MGSSFDASGETLMGAMKLAGENSLELKTQESVIIDMETHVSIVRSALQPDVYLEVGTGLHAQRDRYAAPLTRTRAIGEYSFVRLSVQQTLFDANRNANRILAARAGNLAEILRLRHLEQQVLMRAIKSFFNVRHDRALLDHAKENLDLLKSQLDLELQRFDLGESTLTDLSRIRAYKRRIEIDYQTAKSKLDGSNSAFRKYVGVNVPRKLNAELISGKLPKTLPQAIAIARREHPVLAVDDYLIEEAKYLIEAERAGAHPTLSLNGTLSKGDRIEGRYAGNASIDLRLTIPLSNRKRVADKIAQRRELQYRRQLKRQKHHREIAESVTVVFKAMHMAHLNRKSASSAAREARLSFEYALEERAYGLISTPELLEIHQYMCEAERIKIDQDRAVRVAEFALLAAIGRLTTDWLQGGKETANKVENDTLNSTAISNAKRAVAAMGGGPDYWSGIRKPATSTGFRVLRTKNRLPAVDSQPR